MKPAKSEIYEIAERAQRKINLAKTIHGDEYIRIPNCSEMESLIQAAALLKEMDRVISVLAEEIEFHKSFPDHCEFGIRNSTWQTLVDYDQATNKGK